MFFCHSWSCHVLFKNTLIQSLVMDNVIRSGKNISLQISLQCTCTCIHCMYIEVINGNLLHYIYLAKVPRSSFDNLIILYMYIVYI